MTDYKTNTDYNTKAQIKLIDKQAKLLEAMMKPTVTVTEKTLRDEFAIAALTGLLADSETDEDPEVLCDAAWNYANLMLELRK